MLARLVLIAALTALGAGYPVHAGRNHHPDSPQIADAVSVDEAVAQVTASLETQGYEVVAVIDHAAAAESVGQILLPTKVVLFRDAWTERRLLRDRQTSAIDLPMKILIWEDEAGAIRHKFNAAGYLIDRHGLSLRNHSLRRIDRTLRRFGDLDNGLIDVLGSRSVADTVAVLVDVLERAGFRIPIIMDFSADPAAARRRTRDTTLIIFGNPNVGTQLMQDSREVALDLPQKFLVWEDDDHQTRITYNDPRFIARRGGVQGMQTLLGNIANALANFARQGAGG